MPHAHHFLERLDRVDREQTEFALSLYNDHEAVKFVLEHASLPEVAARVALALDGDPRGPVVVVTRDGRFVTCLGAGMRHDDSPILERPRLEALLAKAADKRARREMVARELRPDEEEGNIFQRVLTRGSRFAREDFMVLSAFEPLLGLAPFVLLLDIGVDAMKTRASMSVGAMNATVNGATRKALEKLDRLEWATAHLTMLAGAAERKTLDKFLNLENTARTTTTFPCTAQGGSTFYLRAAWMVGRFGKAVIPAYKATFERAKDWMNMLDAGLGLAAIALRSSGSAGDVRRILEGYGPAVTTKPATPDESRRNVAAAMLAAIADPEPRIESTLKAGQYLAVSLSAHLPDGHPHRYKTEADVPDDVARTTALCFDATIMNPTMQQYVITAIPVAARAAAEDFYQPRELIKAWYGPWKPEETLVRLQGWIAACAKSEPTRVERTPGRNEPCSCGSGKKWKKCHGAPQSPA